MAEHDSNTKVDGPNRPLLVALALWGVKSRQMALTFFGLCIACAVASAIYHFWPGLIMLLAAWWYWYALRWVDKNASWPKG